MNTVSLPTCLVTSAILLLLGCGSEAGDAASSKSDDQPTAEELAAMQALGGGGEAIKISNRTYTGGSTTVKVSGFFSVGGTQAINQPASITDDGHTWLQYGASGAQELNVLVTNSEDLAENGVNIGIGSYTVTATSTSGECTVKFDVEPSLVNGHYSCKGSTGYDKASGQMGKVDVEVDFNATS